MKIIILPDVIDAIRRKLSIHCPSRLNVKYQKVKTGQIIVRTGTTGPILIATDVKHTIIDITTYQNVSVLCDADDDDELDEIYQSVRPIGLDTQMFETAKVDNTLADTCYDIIGLSITDLLNFVIESTTLLATQNNDVENITRRPSAKSHLAFMKR